MSCGYVNCGSEGTAGGLGQTRAKSLLLQRMTQCPCKIYSLKGWTMHTAVQVAVHACLQIFLTFVCQSPEMEYLACVTTSPQTQYLRSFYPIISFPFVCISCMEVESDCKGRSVYIIFIFQGPK